MRIERNLDLTEFNSYRIHSVAETAYFPETTEEIKKLADSINPIIIGGGCNVIFAQDCYAQPIMFVRDNYSGISSNGECLVVKAGTDLKVLSEYAKDHSLSGVEYYYDIPGCVGGATIMNAGCNGRSFSELLEEVTFYDIEKETISTMTKEEMRFEYRGNVLKDMKVVVLEVVLRLQKSSQTDIALLMENNKENRWAKQPRDYPSAGSVFKRPVGHFVGPMITEVGLKGYRIGDAMISDKHAGFIVNLGNASAGDIISLIRMAQEKVKAQFGVELELEQRIIG
ncbi:MAG: UDP-N-acetylmuramate dehydrogenase [Paludibacteraceae bacterium]|nr:UDP-N-acetylmuramate dehydrogenase [Paludibacteraceae bacterium]MBP5664510.1 UDP-N-acetylmuramate dehydrogenase [Bacteroidales bacterium]